MLLDGIIGPFNHQHKIAVDGWFPKLTNHPKVFDFNLFFMNFPKVTIYPKISTLVVKLL